MEEVDINRVFLALIDGDYLKNINRELTKLAKDLPPMAISAGGDYDKDAENQEELFNNADHALYQTKFNGKCEFTIFKQRQERGDASFFMHESKKTLFYE